MVAHRPKKTATLTEIKTLAENRWPEIIARIGGIGQGELDGRHHPCPKCGGSDRFRMIDQEKGACLCNQCLTSRNGDGFSVIQWLQGISFPDSIREVGNYLGVEYKPDTPAKSNRRPSTKPRNIDPAANLEFKPWNDQTAGLFCMKKKPITVAALKRVGARLATYRKQHPVIALPVRVVEFGDKKADGGHSVRVVGWCLYRANGGTLPHWTGGKNKPPEQVKIKLTWGTKPGIIGDLDLILSAPESIQTLWKTEGPSDLLSLLSLDDIPPHLAAICNAHGASENPTHFTWLTSLFPSVKQIYVCHDADKPGQEGATYVPRYNNTKRPGWGPRLAEMFGSETSVYNVELPFGIQDKHGNDLRDFLIGNESFAELENLTNDLPRVDPPTDTDPNQILESPDNSHRLARLNLEYYEKDHGGRLVYWRNQYWKYKDGVYRAMEKDDLTNDLNGFCREQFIRDWQKSDDKDKPIKNVTVSLVKNVMAAVGSMVNKSWSIEMPCWLPDQKPRNYISMKNGILDLTALFAGKESDECLIPHTPDWFSPLRLEYPFDETSESTDWQNYIDMITDGDEEKYNLLQEWAGYLLWPSTQEQKFLVFEGEGGTGKSTFFSAMTAMLGEGNVSSVSLEEFDDKFQLASTIGKAANIAGDVGKISGNEEAIIKRYTGGDGMNMDRKNIKAVKVYPTAKLMMAWNERPRFRDKSRGLWRRMILIPLNRIIQEHEKNKEMAGWEFWTDHASAIFVWALEGLARMTEQDGFSECTAANEALEDYRQSVNPVLRFFDDCIERKDGEKIYSQSLYWAYEKWCQSENIRQPIADRTFGVEVSKKFGIKKFREGTGIRKYFYEGITLNKLGEIFYSKATGSND